MDEPCDWDVCSKAASPDTVSQLISKTAKKKRTRIEAASASDPTRNKAVECSDQRRPDGTRTSTQTPQGEEGNQRQAAFSGTESPQDRPPQEAPTRKELQDALPKIPPLSSFKNSRCKFVTLEEAELDFHTFITTGLGRTVEIIREFRGRECGDENNDNGYNEIVTLQDDRAVISSRGGGRPRLVSDSSTSHANVSVGARPESSQESRTAEQATIFKHVTETNKKSAVPRIHEKICSTHVGAPSQPESNESAVCRAANQSTQGLNHRDKSKKIKGSRASSAKVKGEPKRETDEEEFMETEEEWSSEMYWKACYEAWSDYYSALSGFPEHGYQSYYSVANNWMAAYRMNTMYMQELMKH